jgi:hypothetical protein
LQVDEEEDVACAGFQTVVHRRVLGHGELPIARRSLTATRDECSLRQDWSRLRMEIGAFSLPTFAPLRRPITSVR